MYRIRAVIAFGLLAVSCIACDGGKPEPEATAPAAKEVNPMSLITMTE